jgi:hypothetical protein
MEKARGDKGSEGETEFGAMWTAIPDARAKDAEKQRERESTRGEIRREDTKIKRDALPDENEGRLIYMRDTYKLCPGLYSRGGGGDLGERRVSGMDASSSHRMHRMNRNKNC